MPGERATFFGKGVSACHRRSVAGAHDGDFDRGKLVGETQVRGAVFVHEVVGMMMALGRTGSPAQAKIREGNQVPFSTATPACERSGHNIL